MPRRRHRAAQPGIAPQQGKGQLWNWPSMQPGIALISDVCLGMFLTMALMGLQLWQMQTVAAFVTTALLVQVEHCPS